MAQNFYDQPLYTQDDIRDAFGHYAASADIQKPILYFVAHAVKQPVSDPDGRYSIRGLVAIYSGYDAPGKAKEAILQFLCHFTGQPACALEHVLKGAENDR